MFKQRLFALSLLLPLTALSGAAYAGQTIADRNYWPSDVRAQTVQTQAQRGLMARDARFERANAMASGAPVFHPSAAAVGRHQDCRYQGGPKSSATCSR
jgi:hypothetical protein